MVVQLQKKRSDRFRPVIKKKMSYLLCGKFEFKHAASLTEKDDFAFNVVEAANNSRFAVQLGVCIVQEIVFEIVDTAKVSEEENVLPFLITDSPVSDVSDKLIDFDDLDGGLQRLEGTLTKLKSFLGTIDDDLVSRTTLYFGEGYDDHYMKITSSLDQLTSDCLRIFSEFNETISLCVEIEG